jgi:hypothetical protein
VNQLSPLAAQQLVIEWQKTLREEKK